MLQNPDDLPKEDVLDRLLVKNLVDYAIFVVSLEGVITLWNVGAERIFGYAEGVIVGQHFGLLFTPEDVAAGAPQAELTSALAGRNLRARSLASAQRRYAFLGHQHGSSALRPK